MKSLFLHSGSLLIHKSYSSFPYSGTCILIYAVSRIVLSALNIHSKGWVYRTSRNHVVIKVPLICHYTIKLILGYYAMWEPSFFCDLYKRKFPSSSDFSKLWWHLKSDVIKNMYSFMFSSLLLLGPLWIPTAPGGKLIQAFELSQLSLIIN